MEEFQKTTIDSYDKTVDEYINIADDLHPHKASTKFFSYLKKGSLILDLGCGPGRDAKIFTQKEYDVTGIDLSENMIEKAKERVKNVKFKVMDIKKLEFEDNHFDAVWASACLLHIPKKDINTTLKEIFRVLKKGGILFISLKQGDGEIFKPDKKYTPEVKKFWSLFQKEEIEDKLKQAGFEILESYIENKEPPSLNHPWMCIFSKKEA